MFVVQRSKHNPIMVPDRDHYWESFAVFNMCPIRHDDICYGLYRAISASDSFRTPNRVSVIGIANSKDNIHFEEQRPFITPIEEWEKYGCEDPRVTLFEGKYYTFYTALSDYPFSAEGIRVAVAISDDFRKVDERHLVTPFNAKAMTLFPERVNGKVTALLSVHSDQPPVKMAIAQVDNIEEFWSAKFWQEWIKHIDEHTIDLKRNPYDHVEVGAPPLKTKYGWLLVYSHIQNYLESPEHLDRIFGIEAVVLDFKDPQKTIARTEGPLLVPYESYELVGYVNNVIFPTGVLLKGDILSIYYGAADSTICMARVSLQDLLSTIMPEKREEYRFQRAKTNPILVADKSHEWEAKAVFNPAAIRIKNTTHILYRAMSEDNTSSIGYAASVDGITINERLPDPAYLPRENFEFKKVAGANSGCEDPRLTQIGKTIYMAYVPYDSVSPPRSAITSISQKNFLERKWSEWSKPIVITPAGFDDKDTCLLPEKVGGKYFILHRVGGEVCGDYFKSLVFSAEMVNKCIRVIGPRANSWDGLKVGISAPPIKTKYGWLLLYHGISKSHHTYRVGAALLSLKDPSVVIARSSDPIFEPVTDYEKNGITNNVVFPCGLVEDKGILYIYYGGADKVVGVATMSLKILIDALVRGSKINPIKG